MEDMNTVIDNRQYIVVNIGSEQFGIDIQYIDNIVRMQRITRVPKAQHYFKGVINLRGEIIPVMSARLRFDLEPDEYTNATRIIILKLEAQYPVGIIVDEVKEVINLGSENIEKLTHEDEKSIYLAGIGKHGDNLISLLSIAGVIGEKDATIN